MPNNIQVNNFEFKANYGTFIDKDYCYYGFKYNNKNHFEFIFKDKNNNIYKYNIKNKKFINNFLTKYNSIKEPNNSNLFIKENIKNYISSYYPSKNKYFIEIKNNTNFSPDKISRKDIAIELRLNGIKILNADNKSDNELRKHLTSLRVNNYPNWIYIENIITNKSKSINNLDSALETNNLLRKYFKDINVIDNNNAKLHPEVIKNIRNHNQLVYNIKNTIIKSLENGTSVLLKGNDNIDYSIDTKTKKPFENILQLYMQQIRKDNKFKSPYFMPSIDVKKNGFSVKKGSFSTVSSFINKNNSQIEFVHYFNENQLLNNNKTLNISKSFVNNSLEIPYIKNKLIKKEQAQAIDIYNSQSITLKENFIENISNYFKSIYTGTPYNPPSYTKEEIKKITSMINNTMFSKEVKEAYMPVKNNLSKLRPLKKKRENSKTLNNKLLKAINRESRR